MSLLLVLQIKDEWASEWVCACELLLFVKLLPTNNTDGLISMDADLSVAIVCLFVLYFVCLFDCDWLSECVYVSFLFFWFGFSPWSLRVIYTKNHRLVLRTSDKNRAWSHCPAHTIPHTTVPHGSPIYQLHVCMFICMFGRENFFFFLLFFLFSMISIWIWTTTTMTTTTTSTICHIA